MFDNFTDTQHMAHAVMLDQLRNLTANCPSYLTGEELENWKSKAARLGANYISGVVHRTFGIPPPAVSYEQLRDLCLYHIGFIPWSVMSKGTGTCGYDSIYTDRHGALRCRECEPPCGCEICKAEAAQAASG